MVKLARKYLPIRRWLGKYEAWLLKLYGSGAFRFADEQLGRFFKYFPPNFNLKKITPQDMSEFLIYRLTHGYSRGTMAIEFQEAKNLWDWIGTDKGIYILNPFNKIVSVVPAPNKNRLKLSDFRRLVNECVDPRARDFVINLGVDPKWKRSPLHGVQLGQAVHSAAVRAGMPWVNIPTLRSAITRSLWRVIIRREYEKLCNTSTDEAETLCDSETNIEVPSTDVGSTVSYDCLDDMTVLRILKGDMRPEGESTAGNG